MNLLLLFPRDFIATDRVRLTDHRLTHLRTIKKISLNDTIEVGLANAQKGFAEVVVLTHDSVELRVQLNHNAPSVLPVHVVLALPRPKMLKRILQTISAMGVKQLSLIHSAKVEKSYWQSPWLQQEKIQQNLILGLEQAKDTIMPEVQCFPRFKPFVEDVLPVMSQNTQAIVAHPGQGEMCAAKQQSQRTMTLAIGPEGGFIDYEIEKFEQIGFQTCHLGERILRVENAIPVLLGRLMSAE